MQDCWLSKSPPGVFELLRTALTNSEFSASPNNAKESSARFKFRAAGAPFALDSCCLGGRLVPAGKCGRDSSHCGAGSGSAAGVVEPALLHACLPAVMVGVLRFPSARAAPCVVLLSVDEARTLLWEEAIGVRAVLAMLLRLSDSMLLSPASLCFSFSFCFFILHVSHGDPIFLPEQRV